MWLASGSPGSVSVAEATGAAGHLIFWEPGLPTSCLVFPILWGLLRVSRRLHSIRCFIFLFRWGNRSVNCLPHIEVTAFRSDARCPLQEVAGAPLEAAKIYLSAAPKTLMENKTLRELERALLLRLREAVHSRFIDTVRESIRFLHTLEMEVGETDGGWIVNGVGQFNDDYEQSCHSDAELIQFARAERDTCIRLCAELDAARLAEIPPGESSSSIPLKSDSIYTQKGGDNNGNQTTRV